MCIDKQLSLLKFMRVPQVISLFGWSRSLLYQKIKEGEFPRPERISKRIVGWRYKVILEKLESISMEMEK